VTDVASRIADQFDSRFLRSYSRSKLRSDPVYRAVLERLRGTSAPLFDIGCGVGLLEFFMRENGVGNEIAGIDHDGRKVSMAISISTRYSGLSFRTGDAREEIPDGHNVLLIDVLQYFSPEDQRRILANAVAAVPDPGMVIIRSAVRATTLRFAVNAVQERFSRAIRWLRAERLSFPSREEIVAAFPGFEAEVVPMWGHTPFNNYLFVFRRSSAGTTKR
jgi:2-polyprenyl-3-methyl-5-hydroxy-6-metoxy-1,4-benzoquinol methylase